MMIVTPSEWSRIHVNPHMAAGSGGEAPQNVGGVTEGDRMEGARVPPFFAVQTADTWRPIRVTETAKQAWPGPCCL